MRVFVTGVKGQLGHDVMNELAKRSHEGIGVDIEEMDITDAESVRKVITEANPDVVIHCAAWTAVDLAEDDDKKEKVHQVNAVGTENIAKVCHDLDCKMIYISTDYVFDGQGTRPWEPDDERHPLNVYGQTKYEGELAVEKWVKKFYIVRIAWVFGVNGKNFIKTMLNLGKTHDQARPTPTTCPACLLTWQRKRTTAATMQQTRDSAPGMSSPARFSNRPLRSIRLTEK